VKCTSADNPFEAGLGFCARLDKDDFIGREASVKIKEQGLKGTLCAVIMDANSNPCGGGSVWSHGLIIGRICSGAYGYIIERDIGLLYLSIELAEGGLELQVEIFGKRVPAQVATIPLANPRDERLRA
jgi:glycine cleavage system aminomethyltransferase T